MQLKRMNSSALKSLGLRLALVLLFLFAENTALAHQVSHIEDGNEHAAASDVHKKFHSDLCSFHAAFESLIGVVGQASPKLALAQNEFDLSVIELPPSVAQQLVVPSSRGPPSFS